MLPTRVGSILGALTCNFVSLPMLPTLLRPGSRVEGFGFRLATSVVSSPDCECGDVMSPEQTHEKSFDGIGHRSDLQGPPLF